MGKEPPVCGTGAVAFLAGALAGGAAGAALLVPACVPASTLDFGLGAAAGCWGREAGGCCGRTAGGLATGAWALPPCEVEG